MNECLKLRSDEDRASDHLWVVREGDVFEIKAFKLTNASIDDGFGLDLHRRERYLSLEDA